MELLARVRAGDEAATNHLLRQYGPLLQRWAHGRLPSTARGLVATEDLVQVTLIRVLRQIEGFDSRHPGAFLAYLRQTLLNQMRNEIRRANRRPAGPPVSNEEPDLGLSAIEECIGGEALAAYEEALANLPHQQRAAVIMRLELDCKHREIAEALDCPTPNAARMLVSRGLTRLAELMREAGLGADDE